LIGKAGMNLKFSANLSMLYIEVPFLDRFKKAAKAGFVAVEFLFPYDAGVQNVKTRLDDLGLRLALFNLPPGNIQKGEWGSLSNPQNREYFRWSFTNALEAALVLKCERLNLMFGQRILDFEWAEQLDCACENLTWAAPQAKANGVTLLIEALNPTDFPNYALQRTSDAIGVLKQTNYPSVKLLYDVYHAQMTEGNLINTINNNLSFIGHIQIADVPGRHQPGTGEINFNAIFSCLEEKGYLGYIGLEYKPEGDTNSSLIWLRKRKLSIADTNMS
jgi:hydroxypyruvate isomerase